MQSLTADTQGGVDALVGAAAYPSSETARLCTRTFGIGSLLRQRGVRLQYDGDDGDDGDDDGGGCDSSLARRAACVVR